MSKIIITILLAIAPIFAYEAMFDWVVREQKYGDYLYLGCIVLIMLFSTLTAFAMWRKQFNIEKKAWLALLPFLLSVLTSIRLWNITSPEGLSAAIKRGYAESIKDDIYSSCRLCSYNPAFDFFDKDLYRFFVEDTAFIRSYMQNCDLSNEKKWHRGALGTSYSEAYTKFATEIYLLWRFNKRKGQQILEYPNGDMALLAMAFAETKPRIGKNFKDALFFDNERIIPQAFDFIEQDSSDSPYFHQGWLDMTDLRALYRHYLKKDKIHKNELEILIYITSKIPAIYINRQDYNRLIDEWKKHWQPFAKDIELLQKQSNLVEGEWRVLADNQGHLPIFYPYGASDSLIWQPLLYSMGFQPVINPQGIHLYIDRNYTLLNEYEKPTYSYQTKERKVYKPSTKYSPSNYKTESYQAQVQTGTTLESTYRIDLFFKYRMPQAVDTFLLMQLPEELAHEYYNKEKKNYDLEYEFTANHPTWFYAVSQCYY